MRTFRAPLRATLPIALAALVMGTGLTAVSAPDQHRVTVTPVPGSASPGPVRGQKVGSAASVLATTGTTTPGFARATGGLLGVTPRGLKIWVDPGARHRGHIVRQAKATVSLWRNLGIPARYAGLGTPRRREGVVTVSEGRAGCEAGTARVGNAWQYWRSLPTGKAYMHSARIVICPRLYRYARWQWSATVRHELGHAAGLGHFDRVYRGSTQVMRWANKSPVSTFKSGDVNGLRFFADNKRLIRSLVRPRGQFEKATWVGETGKVTGWAKLDYYPSKAVKIVVTDSGTRVATSRTDDLDRFVATVPLAGGEHRLCVTAVSTVNSAARQRLGCTSPFQS